MKLLPQGSIGQYGVWRPLHHSARDKFKAIVNCPFCKKDMTLHGYEIDVVGNVAPSVICQTDGCTFESEIQLLGWERQFKKTK